MFIHLVIKINTFWLGFFKIYLEVKVGDEDEHVCVCEYIYTKGEYVLLFVCGFTQLCSVRSEEDVIVHVK